MGEPAKVIVMTPDEFEALLDRKLREAGKGPGVASALPEVMTREQVAKLLSLHPNVVGIYIRKHGLPASKIGGEWRFLRSEILAWIASRKAPTGKEG